MTDAGLSSELLVLRAAVVADAVEPCLTDLCARPLDWAAIVAGAREHRITPQLFAALAPLADQVPGDVHDALRERCRQEALLGMAQVAEVGRLAQLFEAAGIRLILLKGVALSQRLYGDPLARSPGDIDLLVAPSDFWSASDLLREAGYALVGPEIPTDHRAVAGHRVRDRPYRRGGHLVELHQGLTDNPHCIPVDFDFLWEDREMVLLNGVRIAVLPARTETVYLCIHGSRHAWERLRWLTDVAILLGDRGRRSQAVEDADRLGLRRPLRRTAALLELLFTARTEPITPLPGDRLAAARLLRRFFLGSRWHCRFDQGWADRLRRHAHIRQEIYALKGTWRHVVQELLLELHKPADWSLFQLPPRLICLYPLLRPVGWIARRLRAGNDGR